MSSKKHSDLKKAAQEHESGLYHYEEGELDSALRSFNRAFNMVKDNSPKEKEIELLSSIYLGLGVTYHAKEDYSQALEYYAKTVDRLEKTFGEKFPGLVSPLVNMGIIFIQQNDFENALVCLLRARSIGENILGLDRLSLADVYHNLAVIYDHQSRLNDAITMYSKSLRIRERLLGKDHYITSLTNENLAMIMTAQKKYQEALETQSQVVSVRKKTLSNHPQLAKAFHNMGQIYYACSRWNNALPFFEKAFTLRESLLGTDHPSTEESKRFVNHLQKKNHRTNSRNRSTKESRINSKDYAAESLYTRAYQRDLNVVPSSERDGGTTVESSVASSPSQEIYGSYAKQYKNNHTNYEGNICMENSKSSKSDEDALEKLPRSNNNSDENQPSSSASIASTGGFDDDNPYSLYRRKNIPYSVSILGSTL